MNTRKIKKALNGFFIWVWVLVNDVRIVRGYDG